MKKKILIFVAMLIIVFGSVISVHAEGDVNTYHITLGRKPFTQSETWFYYTYDYTSAYPIGIVGIHSALEGSGVYYLSSDKLIKNSNFYYHPNTQYTSENGEIWTSGSGYTAEPFSSDHESIETNIPIFSSIADCENYLRTGDDSSRTNPIEPDLTGYYEQIEDTYDIPYLQNVKYTEDKIDNHNHPFTVTWDTLNNLENECHIEIRAEVMTKEGLFKSKELTENMYKDYFDNISYADGQYTSSIENVVAKIKGTTDLFAYDINKLYLRVAMYDETNKKFMSGGWVRLITDRDSQTSEMPLTLKVDTGFIDKTTGNFVKDTKTDTSYNTTIDGTTGTQITDNPNYIVGTDENGNLDLITLGKSFLNSVNGLFTYIKDIPSFIGRLVLFLPQANTALMCLAILAVIILRILGR